MPTQRMEGSNTTEGFGPQWDLVNTLGVVCGVFASGIAVSLFAITDIAIFGFNPWGGRSLDPVERVVDEVLLDYGIPLGYWAAFAGTVGTLQWYVLRQRVIWVRNTKWILASVVGGVVTGIALVGAERVAIDGNITPLLIGPTEAGIFGSALGLAQWLFMRRHLEKSGWWVLVNGVAGILAGMLLQVEFTDFITYVPGIAAQVDANAIFTLPLFGAVFGIITGVALVWLLQPKAKSGPTRPCT